MLSFRRLPCWSCLNEHKAKRHGPIIRDLDVYDTDQQRGKGVMQKAYETVIGGGDRIGSE